MKVALHSAIYGLGDPPYDSPKPLPDDLPGDVLAIMHTDNPATAERARALGWTVRQIREPRPLGIDRDAHPAQADMMRHKWLKAHPDVACPDADVSLWLDGSMTIVVDRYVERCLEALGDDDFAFVRHPFHTCIYTEAVFSAGLARYPADLLHAQAAYYRAPPISHPANWGLIATGARVTRHSPVALALCEAWWHECVTQTWQDQVSLPVLVRIMAERDGLRWNMNMPWHEWWVLAAHGT